MSMPHEERFYEVMWRIDGRGRLSRLFGSSECRMGSIAGTSRGPASGSGAVDWRPG